MLGVRDLRVTWIGLLGAVQSPSLDPIPLVGLYFGEKVGVLVELSGYGPPSAAIFRTIMRRTSPSS